MTAITWHRLTERSVKTGDMPDADTNVLLGLVNGDVCEGFYSCCDDGERMCWYDVTAVPFHPGGVLAWAEMPEYVP
jgi:hypothetical protein